MTIYRLAVNHVRLLLAATLLGVAVTILFERQFGNTTVPFVGTAILLLVMNLRISRFTCPRCGSNLFVRKGWAWPWPNRVCSDCGLDLGEEPDTPA